MNKQAILLFSLLFFGFSISISFFLLLRGIDRENNMNILQISAKERLNSITDTINTINSRTDLTINLFILYNITYTNFNFFVTPLINQNGLQAISWIPQVQHADRNYFENLGKYIYNSNFTFTEKINNDFINSTQKNTYYPVFYVSPIIDNEKAIGFDLGSSTNRLNAINKSILTKNHTMSERITLVQETNESYGFLILSPIFINNTFHSIISNVFSINNLIAFIFQKFDNDIYNIYIYDNITNNILYTNLNTEITYSNAINLDNIQIHTFDVIDRKWSFILELHEDQIYNKYIQILAHIIFYIVITFTFIGIYLIYKFFNLQNIQIYELNRSKSDLEKSKNIAETATLAKSRFLAIMSHEIRTPLNGMIGAISLLQDTKLDEEQGEYTNILNNLSNSLGVILDDVLIISKAEANKIILEQKSFNINSVIDNVIKIMTSNVRENVEIITFIDHNVPEIVIGDPIRHRQVLMNLLTNACKFTSKGEIIVSVTVDEFLDNNNIMLKFSVQDTGIGIEHKNFKKIFNAFQQSDDSTTRLYGGTGLGLTICHKLVTLFNGVISINSTFRTGSTFSFTSKLAIDNTEINNIINTSILNNLNIFIIDDKESNCFILQKYLQNYPCHTDYSISGLDGIDKILKKHYDILILDYHMPHMNGIEVANLISKNDKLKHIKILFFVSLIDSKFIEKKFSNSICITKPLQKNNFIKVLTNYAKNI